MRPFINSNFMLSSTIAEELFHDTAKNLPIIDYHNHLDPVCLAQNRQFKNLAELWVTRDPYKHRLMRINGIPENEITGNASDRKKFDNWVKTMRKIIGNPLFAWSNLELKRVFGIDEILLENNADSIWQECNNLLGKEEYKAMGILCKWQVETMCTSDDLLDDLTFHEQASRHRNIKVLPSLRGDSIISFNNPSFISWLGKLEKLNGEPVRDLDQYKNALIKRLDEFSNAGCRLSDHSLDGGFLFNFPEKENFNRLFQQVLTSRELPRDKLSALQCHLLVFLGKEYEKREWALQLHVGAQRYTSSRLRELAGPTGGYATIGKSCEIDGLCRLLDNLETKSGLPKIILYTLNPSDNASFATLTGSFSQDNVKGKVQFGPAWWYNDHHDGIKQHLKTITSHGLLSHFIGMTTDSRSLLSFSRHEFFRRILCDFIGKNIKNGIFPRDLNLMKEIVKDICYYNIKNYLAV